MTTITALPAAPTVAPTSPTSPAPAGGGADDFAGLVEANLAGRGTADGAGGAGSQDGDTAEQPDTGTPEAPDPDPTVVLLLSPVALALQAAAGPTAAAPPALGEQGALALAGAGTTGAAGAGPDLPPTPPAIGSPAPGAGSTVQAAAELAGQAVATAATTDSGTPAPGPSDGAGPAADAAPPTTTATSGGTDPGPPSPSTTSPAIGSLTGPAGTPVAGTAGTTATTTAPSTRAASVAEQVQLQVTGMASRGDGTHRIRLTLNPESLGDVSIVLTVRRGAVEVTLAAGGQARVALEQSSPELQRLLELAGARSSTVAVRELVTAATAPTGQGLPGDAWTSSGAGMSGEHPTGGRRGDARPGRSDLAHGVLPDAPSARPLPGSGSRRTSVDVTI